MTYKQELYQTPAILRRVMEEESDERLVRARARLFCGCGTSYYLAAQAAKLCCEQGCAASAADAIDVILDPPAVAEGTVYVFISRSGNSQETVLAMEKVKAAGGETFYLGCSAASRLARGCDGQRVLPYAAETLVLESYSYYAQLLAALRCCGLGRETGAAAQVERALLLGEECAQRLPVRALRRIISLGAPFYRPLLREMMLKDGEITQLCAEEWGILEFRHGPRSWADEHTLILGVSDSATALWDARVARELVSYGCPVLWYGPEKIEGGYSLPLEAARHSVSEILALGAFHTSLAVEIGRARRTTPEALRHVVNNVGEL